MVSAAAEVAEKRGPYRPKANKQRGHDGRKIRLTTRLRCGWGRIGRRLAISEGTKAVGSAEAEVAEKRVSYRTKANKTARPRWPKNQTEAEASVQLGPYRPKADTRWPKNQTEAYAALLLGLYRAKA